MRPEVCVALAALLLGAGCVRNEPLARAASAPAEPSTGTPAEPLVLDACQEMQARFAFAADNYPPEALPPGFTLKPNADGTASVVAIARACERDGASSDTLLVLVEVNAPPELARAGATHGLLLDLWADEAGTAQVFQAWGFQTLEEREMTWDKPLLPQIPDRRMRSEDFVLTIHPHAAPGAVPHASVRVFEVVEAQVTAAFDVDRPHGTGPSGPATASFIMQPPSGTGIDLPFHEAGDGAALDGDWESRYAPVAIGA